MTITVYTKPACFGCGKTHEKLTDAGVSFIEVDITDPANTAALEYISEELGYAQAPVVVYEREGSVNHWAGLNLDKINEIISLEAAA